MVMLTQEFIDSLPVLTEEEEKRDYYDESHFEEDLKSLLEEFNNEVKKIYKFGYMERNDDPFYKYTKEERMNMTCEEYCALIEARNEYVRKNFDQSKGKEAPRFNTIEEFRAYYNCIPLDEAVKNTNKLFDELDEPEFHNESDREQEEFIEQCRRELEARVKELRLKRLQ